MLVNLIFATLEKSLKETVREVQIRDKDRVAYSPEIAGVIDGGPQVVHVLIYHSVDARVATRAIIGGKTF
jgi:hypothetical protein